MASTSYQLKTIYRDGKRTTKSEHVMLAEKALGRPLPRGAKVHHLDGNPQNNAPGNLVICPNETYHQLLHKRTRALDAVGNPDWRPCTVCKTYDAVENMRRKSSGQYVHRSCSSKQACYYRSKAYRVHQN